MAVGGWEFQAVSFMVKLYEQLSPELRRLLDVSGCLGADC
jgi:hypothetical protein